jgi:hypothetical protein
MMRDEPYPVGSQVECYRDCNDKAPRILTVVRHTRTQVILEDGERFTKRGVKVGESEFMHFGYIQPVTKG